MFNHTHPKIIEITFSSPNLYQHAKDQFIPSIHFWDIANFGDRDQSGHTHFWISLPKTFKINFKFSWICIVSGVILETEGGIWGRYKKALFPYKKLWKGTSDLSNPYVHGTFKLLLIKQFFQKNKSWVCALWSYTAKKMKFHSRPNIEKIND